MKLPFFKNRVSSLSNLATKEGRSWLSKREKFDSNGNCDERIFKEAANIIDDLQTQDLRQAMIQHKLIRKPPLRNDRLTSADEEEKEKEGKENKVEDKIKISRPASILENPSLTKC